MSNPLVSIVVSAYNRPEMLRAALHSLKTQIYENLEILIQDDSTNDECQNVVSQMADHRFQYTHNIPPLGTAANLRAGYMKSSGKYFSTLNDDDLYAPNYISEMIENLERNPKITVAFGDHFLIDESERILLEESDRNTHVWGRDLLQEGVIDSPIEIALVRKSIPAMFAVFRKESMDLSDFPDEVSSGYDYWLTYLAVRDGNPAYYSAKRLTYYRVHGSSQTAGFSDPTKRLQFSFYGQYMHKRLLSDRRLQPIHPPLQVRLAEAHRSAGLSLLQLARRGEACREFIRSLRIRRTSKAFLGLILCAAPKIVLREIFDKK